MKRATLLLVFSLLSFAWLRADPQFIPMDDIHPGQTRYSSAEVQAKVNRLIERGYVLSDQESQTHIIQHDNGRSALGDDWVLPVVRGPFGYVLIDGHHSYLAARELGASTIPVELRADFSDLDEIEFWTRMGDRGWAYFVKLDGKQCIPPRDFADLEDDPNRYLAALTVRCVCELFNQGGSRGSEYPLWIKVGEDQPFIEFRIADALWKGGVAYDYALGDQPPEELVEAARQILLKASIDGLWVVPHRIHYSQLDKTIVCAD